jgi:hypothetical protein
MNGKGDKRRPITGDKAEVQKNIDAFYARLEAERQARESK